MLAWHIRFLFSAMITEFTSALLLLRIIKARSVIEFIGEKTSNDYGKNTEIFQQLLRDKPGKVIPAMILLCFENDTSSKYYLENSNGFPTHNKNIWLDRCYDWLISLGYEMSDDEIGLRDGTHEIFKRDAE